MRKLFRFLVWVGIFGAIIAGILRATFLDVWSIPTDDPLFSASIAPNLAGGDVVVLLRRGTPTFGDLVRCLDPDPARAGRHVVGRILGEAGDNVVSDGMTLKINNKTATIERGCNPNHVKVADPNTGEEVELWCDIEELGGASYMRLRSTVADARTSQMTTEVAPGNVFIASDDRYFHDDSRDFGAIPLATCTERVVFRLWSAKGWLDSKSRLTFIQ